MKEIDGKNIGFVDDMIHEPAREIFFRKKFRIKNVKYSLILNTVSL